jgi:hypothetical protein
MLPDTVVECSAVPGQHLYWLQKPTRPDSDGRIALISVKDSSRGYNALPNEFREITDPQQLEAIEWWLRKLKKL